MQLTEENKKELIEYIEESFMEIEGSLYGSHFAYDSAMKEFKPKAFKLLKVLTGKPITTRHINILMGVEDDKR